MEDLHVFKKPRELTYYNKTVVIDLAHSRLLRTKVAIISLFRSPFIWLCLDKNCNTICSLSLFGLCRHRLAAGGGVSSESGSWSRWDWTNEYRWAASSPRVPSTRSGHHQGTIYCKESLQHLGVFFLSSMFITSFHPVSFSSLDLFRMLQWFRVLIGNFKLLLLSFIVFYLIL